MACGMSRLLAWAVVAVLTLGTIGLWIARPSSLHVVSGAFAADVPQDAFEQRIRSYLLSHPEVIAEALNRLQAKQDEQDAAAAKAMLKAHSADVFQDPDSPVGGNPNGNVTLVEFFDYNCPYCRAMAPVMEKAEAADPQLRIVYKEFPILNAGSIFAAKAALAANKQGKYVAFHRALYQVRGQVEKAKVLEVAGTVGLDIARMKADMQDAAIERMLDKNNKLGQALHITGTPGFVIGDEVRTGATDLNGLQALISKGREPQQSVK